MLFDDLCLKIYFWPFLSYLASLKGLCPFYPPGYFPFTTMPPNNGMSSTSPIPTFQPTPPTTLPPCPADPLVCLAGGERPIPYCPCIDPRQQNGQTTTTSSNVESVEMPSESEDIMQSLQLRLAPSYPTAVMDTEVMIFSHLDNTKRRRRRKRRDISKKEY
ncbi:uncharacterized protein LOC135955354 [Calliphora vicina]|uniref:uncharacterized protein LOC135955354 n=1 Tax=Calliphora vicina TaxID=7373 RepID=UPI00325AE7AD